MELIGIDELHSLAIEINESWEDVKYLKRHFVNEDDFYNFVIAAIETSKAGN